MNNLCDECWIISPDEYCALEKLAKDIVDWSRLLLSLLYEYTSHISLVRQTFNYFFLGFKISLSVVCQCNIAKEE